MELKLVTIRSLYVELHFSSSYNTTESKPIAAGPFNIIIICKICRTSDDEIQS